ncbi:MAG: DEAD/DEAH box helicase, partial [Candidatus Rokubacteria bacterium]|nr:DEAD/DEAH box helicase [Candidatus Rokubacteria bacterium]
MHDPGWMPARRATVLEFRTRAMQDSPLARFSLPVRTWFHRRFSAPTDPQRAGWPAIASGTHTLITAPTGSGKTLAAFLFSLDHLVQLGERGALTDAVHVLYV